MSESRDILIDKATELFLAKGFTAVGTKELCSAASMNKGTFYHYFPSKADLLVSVIKKYSWEFLEAFNQVAISDLAPRDKLTALFNVPMKANIAWSNEHGYAQGCLIGNMTLELNATDETVRSAIRQSILAWYQPIAKVIGELIECGEIPDIDRFEGAELIITLMQGGLLLAKTMNDPSKISRLAYGALFHLRSLS